MRLNMKESFKINIYFDEKGEDLENLIEHLIIIMLEKKYIQIVSDELCR